MHNSPRRSPDSKHIGHNQHKNPLITVCIRVDRIFQLNSNIIAIGGSDPGELIGNHEISLYGKNNILPNPKDDSIMGKVLRFRIRLTSIAISASGKETERAGNIHTFLGAIDIPDFLPE